MSGTFFVMPKNIIFQIKTDKIISMIQKISTLLVILFIKKDIALNLDYDEVLN